MSNALEESGGEFQIVVFKVGAGEFAIKLELVREIISLTKLVKLPGMPSSMIGIIDVRGSILPVVDLKIELGLEVSDLTNHSKAKILIAEIENSLVGYLVDDVSEALRVPKESLQDTSEDKLISGGPVSDIYSSNGRIIPILNGNRLLTYEDNVRIKEFMEEKA